MIHSFSVTEARCAIVCPRIFYFDEIRFRRSDALQKKMTAIWSGGADTTTACGTIFHNAIERFNKEAASAAEVLDALRTCSERPATEAGSATFALNEVVKRYINTKCLNRRQLAAKDPSEQQAFIRALDHYVKELVEKLARAVRERPPENVIDEFFGDNRKSINVTILVGPDDTAVNVRGALDYIYYDVPSKRYQILDFKLLPANSPSKDLMQVAIYALTHNQQHQSSPDATVLYLHPKQVAFTHSWAEVFSQRFKVYDLLSSMAGWSTYNEKSGEGLKPPGEPSICSVCPWDKNDQCVRRLGAKLDGGRITRWESAAQSQQVEEPKILEVAPAAHSTHQEVLSEDVAEEMALIEAEDRRAIDEAAGSAKAETAFEVENRGALLIGSTIHDRTAVLVPRSALPTHIAVLGAAGSGKSWLAKVVAEEAIGQGVPLLAIDPQGDLVQFLCASRLPDTISPEVREAQARFRERVEVRIWTPATSHGIRLCLSPMRIPKESELGDFENPARRREEWDAILGVAASNLVQLAQAGGDTESQQTFLLEVLRALSQRSVGADIALGLDQVIAAVNAPEGLDLPDVEQLISKRDREKLQRRLVARLRGPSANLFQGGVSLDVDRFVEPLDSGKTPLNVIYLNAMQDDSQKQYFVAALAAEVYRWMLTTATGHGGARLVFFLDEAKDFLPAGAAKPPAKGPLLRLFAQGRKYGVSCLLCTQSPRSVDYQVFSNASTKLIGRLEASQDVDRVSEWFANSGAAPTWLAGRKGAKSGTFVGRWPGIAPIIEGKEFQSRPLYSLHEGAWSPERVEQEWAKSPLSKRFSS